MAKQKRKTYPLLRDTTGTFNVSRAAHVMMFVGTKKQFIILARLDSKMWVDLRVDMDGK